MPATVEISLPGLPRGKGRPRFSVRGGHARAYTDDKTASFEGALRMAGSLAMQGREIFDGPLCVEMHAVFPIPKSWPNKKRDAAFYGRIRPTGKPDCDNLLKTIDALNGIVWGDDAQVVRAVVVKVYGAEPGLGIVVKDWAL